MTILGLECSAKAASAAVTKDGELLCETFTCVPLTHSQTLLPMAESMLKNANLTLSAIDCLAVAAGPGSFTGLRIGIAAVKGLAMGLEIPCCAVSTLEAMAYGLTALDGTILPVMDARCGQVYAAAFDCSEGTITRLCPDRAVLLEELFRELNPKEKSVLSFYKKPFFLVGDGARMCYNNQKDQIADLRLCPLNLVMQRAAGVCLAAEEQVRQNRTLSPEQLLPAYLRLPQAERELLAKEKNQIPERKDGFC